MSTTTKKLEQEILIEPLDPAIEDNLMVIKEVMNAANAAKGTTTEFINGIFGHGFDDLENVVENSFKT